MIASSIPEAEVIEILKEASVEPMTTVIIDETKPQKEVADEINNFLQSENLTDSNLIPVLSEKTQLVPEYLQEKTGKQTNPILIGEKIRQPFIPEKIRFEDEPHEDLFNNLTKIRPVIIVAPSDIEPEKVEDILDELDTKADVDVIVGDDHIIQKMPLDIAKGNFISKICKTHSVFRKGFNNH